MYDGPRNKIEVHPNDDGTFDFRFVAAENGDILCGSRQGYERAEDARHAAIRAATAPYIVTFTQET